MNSKYQKECQRLVIALAESDLKLAIPVEEVSLVSDIGRNKWVFSIPYNGRKVLAAALPRDVNYDLSLEFSLLKRLYDGASHFFPQPEFYIETSHQKVMGMELLLHKDLENLPWELSVKDERELAYRIGFALGYTYGATGLYTQEPHDNNIMAIRKDSGVLEVKLVDAMAFTEGSLKDLIEAAMDLQELCRLHSSNFKEGLGYGRQEGSN